MANNAARNTMGRTVSLPIELYESMQGRYFVGYADNLNLGSSGSAWARLYNPKLSGVNLYVDSWTVASASDSPFRARFWFNADPPGNALTTTLVSPANLAFRPVPQARVSLQKASNVYGEPEGGAEAFSRQAYPAVTLSGSESGKLIFPPGGSFLIYVTLTDPDCSSSSARVTFGWWEERIS